MKKFLLSITAVVALGATSIAQIQLIKDGGFQGTYVSGAQVGIQSPNVGGTTLNMSTLDWVGVMKQEAVTPITSTKSALIVNVDDSVAAATFGGTEPKTSGLAQQVYRGGALMGKTPSDFTFSFKYTYAPAALDTAFALVTLVDSNLTNVNGANIVYQGLALMTATTSASAKTITSWGSGPATNVNRAIIVFGSSVDNYYTDAPAPAGSKLIVDDVSFSIISAAGLNDLTNASSVVYPNPVANTLNVEITNAEATSISIFSLDGTLVKTQDLSGVKGSVNVENLNTGMYLYTISTKGGAVIQSKFLKN